MPISCRVTRGELTESMHVAFATVVGSQGQIIYSTGDPHYMTCARSSLKPFQAAAVVNSGAADAAGYEERELALMCASHIGQDIHLMTAQSMLSKLGLSIKDYECGVHQPVHQQSKNDIIRQNKDLTPLYNNCSGKHAGMLALARYLKTDVKNYTHVDHPVQREIIKYLEVLTNLTDIKTGIDGCSLPTPFMSLEKIAMMFQMLACGEKPELKTIFNAMSNNPEMIRGNGYFDTEFITAMDGNGISKVGAEAVKGISMRTDKFGEIGIAIKILDGNNRAMPIILMKLFDHLELLNDYQSMKLDSYRTKVITNHNGKNVGNIEVFIDF